MALVDFMSGDGTVEQIDVLRIAQFARGQDGRCAYCCGDPCAEDADNGALIYGYFRRNSWADTCPCCDGRAT